MTDDTEGALLPAKVVLYDALGNLLHIGILDVASGDGFQDEGYCELGPGVFGTWSGLLLTSGRAEVEIGTAGCNGAVAVPYGTYRVRVMCDTEHEIFDTAVDLGPNRGVVSLAAILSRAFRVEGHLSADLHLHALTSGDSLMPRDMRVITLAVAGIRVISSTDHNFNGDYGVQIATLGLENRVASLPGNEVSTNIGHFNVFPVLVDEAQPRGGAPDYTNLSAESLFAAVDALPGQPLIQVNHPRGWMGYFDRAGWDGESWPPPMPLGFDALEVLSGFLAYDTPMDHRLGEAIRDFYTLAGHGVFTTPLGNSDSHHLNGILAGFPRTYVRVDGMRNGFFNVEGFLRALRDRHTIATTGPFLEVHAGAAGPGDFVAAQDGTVALEIVLHQASYVHATHVRILVGGEVCQAFEVPMGSTHWSWTGIVPVGAADTWIGVDAGGDDPLPDDLVGDYLSAKGGMRPFALVSPILVDADGDGLITLGPGGI